MFSRRKLRNEEIEKAAGIERNVPRSPTRNDVEKIERKILGPLWGKRRRKMEGWPK